MGRRRERTRRGGKATLTRGDVEVNSKDQNNQIPLSHAAENGHGRVVTLLLAHHGIEPDVKARGDWNSIRSGGLFPFSYATEKGHDGGKAASGVSGELEGLDEFFTCR